MGDGVYRVGKGATFFYLDAADVGKMIGVSRARVGELARDERFGPQTGPHGYRVWERGLIERWALAYVDRETRGASPDLPVYGPLAPAAERVGELARAQARELNHHWVGEEHLLLALAGPSCPGSARPVLESLGFSLDLLRTDLVEAFGPL